MSDAGDPEAIQVARAGQAGEQTIEQLRKKLLDLRTSNRLLHFPHAERARSYVRVVDELPELLCKKLDDGKALRIAPLPALPLEQTAVEVQGSPIEQAARSAGFDPSFELPTPSEQTVRRHGDDTIQTLLFEEVFQTTLQKIWDTTRSMQEEQGIHTLFAAFGFLEWYESTDSQVPRFAPIVLYPLTLARERKLASYEYAVSAHDEERSLNLALLERLTLDFRLTLPALEEEEELSSYFTRLLPAISSMPRWKLHRWVTLTNFSFARIAMYHDLAAERWPEGQAPAQHATFLALTSDRRQEQTDTVEPDPEHLAVIADELSSLVLDADTSQVAAIMEALKERNLVIKGPPGTGKSQTIANLIASALQKNLRVLFVAEKMAALEVVKARLDQAGLGAFCLELHSHRATRKAVMHSIAERLELTPAPHVDHESERARSRQLRRRLNEYAAQLNAPSGSLGLSVHDLIWRREAARREVESHLPLLDKLRLPGVSELTMPALDAVHHTLAGFVQAAHDHQGSFAEDPRSLFLQLTHSDLDEHALLSQLERYREELSRLREIVVESLGHAGETLTPALTRSLQTLCLGEPRLEHELQAALLHKLDSAESIKTLRGVLAVLTREQTLSLELRAETSQLSESLARLEPLRQAAKSLVVNPTDETLAALTERATALATDADEQTEQLEKLATLLRFCGVESAEAPESVLSFCEALTLLAEAPRSWLHALRVSPALLEENNLAKLRALQGDAQVLLERRTALDQRIVRTQHERELRERGADYALALQRPWWWAWMFGLFWKARALHRRIALAAGSSAAAMSQDLLESSRLLHALDTYRQRGDAQALLGSSFDGVDTDFESLGFAASWARKVNSQLSRLHPAYPPLRRLLLTTELSQLDTLQTETKSLSHARLAELAKRAQRTRLSLLDTLESDRRQARQTLLSTAAFRDASVRVDLTVGELAGLLARLDELARIHAQLPVLGATLRRLGVEDEPLSLILPALDETARAAEWAREQGIDRAALTGLATPALRSAFAAKLAQPLAREHEAREELERRGMTAAALQQIALPFPDAVARIEHTLSSRALLRAQLRFLRERDRAASSFAAPVVHACASGALPLDQLQHAADYLLYHELIQRALEQSATLRDGNGSELSSVQTQYAALDRQVLTLNARRLAAELSRVRPPDGIASGKKSEWSELSLLRHELSKRMRHVPLRQLMARAGKALGALKPCLMMSPLSVAQILPPMAELFDLVVIDEASQMRPEDAMGAIVRARRAVVVGDPKQLPPTSFFQRGESLDEQDDNHDEAVDAESILDLGLASFGASTDLRWHYRSRHPSLIAFSNEHFYDGRLKVFPAPSDDRSELGVELVRVAGEYAASTNLLEARAIAGRVLHHVHHRPRLSLGVAAMNQKQKDLILEEIARLDDERVRAFVDAEQTESGQPFFVKSLENVQGDERDVIFVSMTYGPEPTSKRVFQRFGPLNSEHGARRLNVLLTRARRQLVVFSSLKPEDILVDERSSLGLKSLRSYLVYAETGQLTTRAQQARGTDSPFEDAVRELLSEAGYETTPQVGVQGFFIDLGVRVRGQNGYLCGIECDGAAYHSTRSARDRDRLRQEILEGQGWKILRVWSTDWFREPRLARARLLAQVAALAAPT